MPQGFNAALESCNFQAELCEKSGPAFAKMTSEIPCPTFEVPLMNTSLSHSPPPGRRVTMRALARKAARAAFRLTIGPLDPPPAEPEPPPTPLLWQDYWAMPRPRTFNSAAIKLAPLMPRRLQGVCDD
jgi:hypothetical protein